jgi:hypothetical protein
MANYWERPTAEQFNFTPYRPPIEETLGAIAAKTQYYTDTLNRIKTEYDSVAGKEVSRDDSKEKLSAFRESVEPRLKDLAKKDLSIGSYRNEALSLYEPILKDKGILIDEATTEKYSQILKQAKEDASKNGGKYYNQYSVEYASQMMERYKRESNAENSDYHSILTSTGYIPYNQEAENEIRKSVEKLSKETVMQDFIDADGKKHRRSYPAYDTASMSALIRESLSPAARQQYDLQARVEFNRYQLNSKTPEQLQAVGQTIKNQFDTFYNEQIGILDRNLYEVDRELKVLSENDPEYTQKKEALEQNRTYFETQKKQAQGEKDKIDPEYFSNPSNWKLGETYYSDLYLNNKIRNTAVALGNRKQDDLISMDVYNAQTARMKALKEKDGKDGANSRPMAEAVPSTTTVGSAEENGDKVYEALKSFKITNTEAFSTQVQKAMDITTYVEGKGKISITEAFKEMPGNTPMTKLMESMGKQGSQSMDAIIHLLDKKAILKENSEAFDKDGNIRWDKITVQQAKNFIHTALSDDKNLPAIFEKAGYDGNQISTISNLYLENAKRQHKDKLTTGRFEDIYKNTLEKHGIKLENEEDIFNFDNSKNIEKEVNFNNVEKAVGRKLSSDEKQRVINYVRGNINDEEFLETFSNFAGFGSAVDAAAAITGAKPLAPIVKEFGSFFGNQREALAAFAEIKSVKDKYSSAIKDIKEQISKSPSLTFNTVEANYTYNAKPSPTDDKSSQPYINYTEFQNLLANSTSTPDGSSPDGNVSKYETMINDLRNLGGTDLIKGVRFVAGADGEMTPYMLINVDYDGLKKLKGELPESDDGTMWWRDGDIESQLKGKGVKIYLTNPELYKKFIQIPDRSIAFLQGNKNFNVATYSGQYDKSSNNSIMVKNIGYGNDIVPAIEGKTRMITSYDPTGKIIFENVSFSPNNMDAVSKYQGITPEVLNPKSGNYKGLETAVGYMLNEDAKLVALEKLAKSWNILEQKDGKYYINLQGLSPDRLEKITKLIKDGKIGN